MERRQQDWGRGLAAHTFGFLLSPVLVANTLRVALFFMLLPRTAADREAKPTPRLSSQQVEAGVGGGERAPCARVTARGQRLHGLPSLGRLAPNAGWHTGLLGAETREEIAM